MIVTVTPNAALDRSYRPELPARPAPSRERRAHPAGGKGINVARALKRLEGPVVATGLAGGANGTRIVEELDAEAILNDFVRIATSRALDGGHRPDVRAGRQRSTSGGRRSPGELEMLMEKLRYLSRGAERSSSRARCPRRERRRSTPRRRASSAARRPGGARHRGRAAAPRAWRRSRGSSSPNQHEAEQLVGQELFDDDDFLMALDAIAELGARNVHRPLENGCFALVREERRVKPVSRGRAAAGAGLGRRRGRRLLAQWLTHLRRPGAEEAIRLAAATGAASVLEVGAGRFDPAEARRLAVVRSRCTSSSP